MGSTRTPSPRCPWSKACLPGWPYKAYQTEAGTRSTGILHVPGLGKPGSILRFHAHVTDDVPTMLELTGVAAKTEVGGRPVQPIRGLSWVPVLSGKAAVVRGPDDIVGGELFGSRKLRQGDWKITDTGDGRRRLFNLARDPGETSDLATQQPERLQLLSARWEAWASDVGVVLPDQRLYTP